MDLDATDAAILRCLQEDARASLRTIAKEIGVSVPTVSARLRNLEELGVVRGYRVLLDTDRLEGTGAALLVKTRAQDAEAIARRIAGRSWARRVLMGRPGWILVDVSVNGGTQVEGIVEDLSRLPGIADVQSFVGLTTLKDEPAIVPGKSISVNVSCFECKGPIHGEGVRVRLDGRYHYFCCHVCERTYVDRYTRIRAAAHKRINLTGRDNKGI